MLHFLGSLPRRARWALQRWTSSADQAFHDSLFSGPHYDPFTFAYPGYVTIRRFADLAEARLDGVAHAVDLGCGPGEITCELARRRPEIRFTGVDHSVAAIARATGHARRLELANITFVAADIATWNADPRADIVLMFDAFHHVLDPAEFVRRTKTDRFFLIEPGGDWLGGWERALDLDWIVPALDTMRARIAWQLSDAGLKAQGSGQAQGSGLKAQGSGRAQGSGLGAEGQEGGAPVEHRYTIGDFTQFFDGFGLDVRGTIAGVEDYPPDAYGAPPLREPFGKITYETMVAIEELLVKENLDLHAKHWAIYAERGAPHALRTPRPIATAGTERQMRLQGQYDVEFVGPDDDAADGRRSAAPQAAIVFTVVFRNGGWRTWSSDDPRGAVFLSYHWLDSHGAIVIEDGLRTPLPRAIAPGETCTMSCRIEAPAKPGRYILAIDLVEEGVTWFSRAGAALLKLPFDIR